MQLLDIFRARCVDVSESSLTICVSGDAGKVSSLPVCETPVGSALCLAPMGFGAVVH